ncbi:MAG TPA: glycosyltransferase family 4 protein [Candidatus Margulisiibacteriota bacterium]|nr:glycosyltransferase family 4 protein [Candidatus Margulisiibacteriota bacterium]
MTTVLTLVPYYLPGHKSGGPVRSLANLVEQLAGDVHFIVVTSDRDCGDTQPYPGIVHGARHRVGKAEVIYLDPATVVVSIARAIRATRADILYLNSFFSPAFSILPVLLRRLGLIRSIPIVLAPRGEFSPGALGIKPFRKRAFLAASAALGLHAGITWQASSPFEAAEIRHALPARGEESSSRSFRAPVVVAPDLADAVTSAVQGSGKERKAPGQLRVIFMSRLSQKKNLLGALEVLAHVRGRLEFTICGPLEDSAYWAKCQRAISALPSNINVSYIGAIEHARVPEVLAAHDLFFFPTLGENYGHVILEALIAGCPVLLSDQTPWRNLAVEGVGWEFPLQELDAFRSVIERCIEMDSVTFAALSERAAAYGRQRAHDPSALEANRSLFRSVISRNTSGAVQSPALT